jgi:hypothetical protein
MGSKKSGHRIISGLLFFAFAATLVYWIVFYTTGETQVRQDPIYLAFERSFPVADTWMALCALIGAIGLWNRKPWGFLFGLLAASSAIFLGLMDLTFNLNEGIYAIPGLETTIEVLINLLTLGLGPVVIAYLWLHRRNLICPPPASQPIDQHHPD